MMFDESGRTMASIMLVCLLSGSMVGSTAFAQTGSMHSSRAPARSGDWHAKEGMFYKRNWGVDVVGVRVVSSGWMLRFDYRVLDEQKARPLFDKNAKPYLVDEASGTLLAVPTMENVGELRQSTKPEVNRTYFMIFGNPGKLVKAGSHVSVVIGNFRVEGLTVD